MGKLLALNRTGGVLVGSSVLALALSRRGATARNAARRGLVADLVASVVSDLAIKPLVRRQRPPGAARGTPSLPSGHTARSTALAVAVGRDLPALRPLLGAYAAGVGFAGVRLGLHYPSDVVAGAVVGAAAGMSARAITRSLRPVGTTTRSRLIAVGSRSMQRRISR